MDPIRTGLLIRRLRKSRQLTQRALAGMLHVTDKTVSKWETGAGCPDISILSELAAVFGVRADTLLQGEITEQEDNGNMKQSRFYVCPGCGNILTSSADAGVDCCGKRLTPLEAQEAQAGQALQMELTDDEWYITSSHPMTKDNYIHFIACLTDSSLLLHRLYPEWSVQVRMPYFARGRLLWYSTDEGLLYRDIRISR